jgi:hypothetical protein
MALRAGDRRIFAGQGRKAEPGKGVVGTTVIHYTIVEYRS